MQVIDEAMRDSELTQRALDILVLEDEPADVVLINHALRLAQLSFHTRRVATKEEFLAALRQHRHDLILSDSALPEFSGYAALSIAKDVCPDTPFIFVTGSMGEEKAIEVLRSGATDYVLKSRLENLVPAIQRALREADHRIRRKQAELALHQSEERLRTLLEGVKDYAIFMLDPAGCVTSWNLGAEWIHQYTASEVVGQHFSCLFSPPHGAQQAADRLLQFAAKEGRVEEEGWRCRKGGSKFWANTIISALHDENGQLRGFAQVTRDITERKQAEESLRQSEVRKAAILSTALDAFALIDHQGTIREWNPAAQRMFGYLRAEALGKKFDDLIIPVSMRAVYRDGLAEYLLTGVGSLLGRPIELATRRADATEFRVEMAITRIPGEEPPLYSCFIRDLTERHTAQTALRRSEDRYRMLLENVHDYAIYMLDPEGRVTTWNYGAERLEGYRAEEIIGRDIACIFPPEEVRRGKVAQILREAAQGRFEEEGWRMHRDGSRYFVNMILTPLRDEAGRLYGFAKIARDITARKQAEEEVRQLNAELEERVAKRTVQLELANQELEAFSYSVSHDLRAPLRHINGFVGILQTDAGNMDEKQRHYLERVAHAARHMGQLIDSLLEFSRMSRLEIQWVEVNLAQLAEAARAQIEQDAQGRSVDWVIGPLPAVRGEPSLLFQVLVNLLSNALKYTRPRPTARIELGCEETADEWTVYIRDNGVGFDMAYANKLFGVFQRLHRATDFEGTGIGLANVRRIIQRHGGRTWAKGVENQGATFYFCLPKNGPPHECPI